MKCISQLNGSETILTLFTNEEQQKMCFWGFSPVCVPEDEGGGFKAETPVCFSQDLKQVCYT